MKRFLIAADIFEAVFDAIPSPIFIVDADVGIHGYNSAAAPFFDREPDRVLRMGHGDALHCIHSTETPEGCGGGEACKQCVVRISVDESYHGNRVVRKKTEMQLVAGSEEKQVQMLVTTAPLTYKDSSLVILILEDITELVMLRGILPICASCKKVREDNQYWQNVENYLTKYTSVQITHGICPECAKKLYPDLDINTDN